MPNFGMSHLLHPQTTQVPALFGKSGLPGLKQCSFAFIFPNLISNELLGQKKNMRVYGHPSSLAKGYDSGPPSLHPWRI